MANLNLSEFGEKLFVADADHTFIWDTANAISKRVSRNSWLNSGTLTSDAPVTISQTWNAVGQTFKALVVNAAGTSGTNSTAGSLLADFQLAGVSQFSVTKAGSLVGKTETNLFSQNAVNINGSLYSSNIIGIGNNLLLNLSNVSVGISLAADYPISWSSNAGSSNYSALNTVDVQLRRDAPNTLALRNGVAAQTFNVYGTYTSGTVYERLTLSAPSAANAIIGTNKGSGGGTARGLEFQTDGVKRIEIQPGGNSIISNTLTVGGNINVGYLLRLASLTVSTLPAASGALFPTLVGVTDSTVTAAAGKGNTVVGGGSNKVIVMSDGTNWIIL